MADTAISSITVFRKEIINYANDMCMLGEEGYECEGMERPV
jgi:hypothetical protein